MMEPWRPILADSTVLMVVNNGEITPTDFTRSGGACSLKTGGRKALIRAFERRLEREATHPLFGYRLTMRRVIEVQMRLFGRHLDGELKDYPHYTPR